MAGFDINDVKGNDRIIILGGLVVFIASFFPWYGASASGAIHFSASVKGWSAGGSAVLGILLCLAAAAFVLLRATGQLKDLSLPVGPALIVLALAGLAVLLFLIRWLSLPSGSGLGFSYGPRIGLFLGLAGAIVQAVFAALTFSSSGETLPGRPEATPPPQAAP